MDEFDNTCGNLDVIVSAQSTMGSNSVCWGDVMTLYSYKVDFNPINDVIQRL